MGLDYEVARNLSLSHLNPIMIIIIIGLFLGEFILLALEEKIERDYSLLFFLIIIFILKVSVLSYMFIYIEL